MGSQVAIGVLCGAALAVGNFWLLSRLVVQLTSGDELAVAPMLTRLFSKLAVLAICLFALIVLVEVDVLGLLVGLSVVILSTLLAQAFGLLN